MEAVVFVGGVSLGQPATSIPIAAIVGIICGVIIGFMIYEFASRTSKPLQKVKINYSSFFFIEKNSFKYLPRRHDQSSSPHRSGFIQ